MAFYLSALYTEILLLAMARSTWLSRPILTKVFPPIAPRILRLRPQIDVPIVVRIVNRWTHPSSGYGTVTNKTHVVHW